MADKIRNLIIGSSTPNEAGVDWTNFAWIDIVHRQIKLFEGGKWVVSAELSDTLTIPDILEDKTLKGKTIIQGTLITGDSEGISEEIPIKKIDTLVFQNGILIKVRE